MTSIDTVVPMNTVGFLPQYSETGWQRTASVKNQTALNAYFRVGR